VCAFLADAKDVTHPRNGALHPVPDATGPGDLLAELGAVLWQERELLEDLLYALVQQHQVLDAGDPRWLARADAAVADSARAVQGHEVFRAMETDTVLALLGLTPAASLLDIADAAGEPWTTLLREHRSALLALTTEIEQAAARNRTLLVAGERSTRAALEQAGLIAPATSTARRGDRP
jgi:hypothetical protein